MTKRSKKKAGTQPVDGTGAARAEKRANAYSDMEPHLCDVVRMGEIAMMLFDNPDQGLFVFAVGHLEEMLQDLRAHYYAEEFPI